MAPRGCGSRKSFGAIDLRLLGQHNLSNALAAVAVGRLLGLDFPVIAKSIATLRVPVAALSSEAKPMA